MTSVHLCGHGMYNKCKYSGNETRSSRKYLNIIHLYKERRISSGVDIKQEDAIMAASIYRSSCPTLTSL